MTNTPDHAVLSAFLDNEPFNAAELGDALAAPGGRELFIDLIALRHLVQDDPAVLAPAPARTASTDRRLWAAAGFLAATVVFGVASAVMRPDLFPSATPTVTPGSDIAAPPRPDRVVKFEPGLEWHDPTDRSQK
jgi:hypothetical protein